MRLPLPALRFYGRVALFLLGLLAVLIALGHAPAVVEQRRVLAGISWGVLFCALPFIALAYVVTALDMAKTNRRGWLGASVTFVTLLMLIGWLARPALDPALELDFTRVVDARALLYAVGPALSLVYVAYAARHPHLVQQAGS